MGGWTLEGAQEKVQQYIDQTPLESIEVLEWTREMDLHNLTDKKCRVLDAAHLYVDFVGVDNQLNKDTSDDDLKQMIQAMHAYTRVAIDAVETKPSEPGRKVQFQGLRTHAIFFKPYKDPAGMCHNAIAALCYLRIFVRDHFKPTFPSYPNAKLYAGLDWGSTLATNIGTGEDREPLFIGDAANQPAKKLAADQRKALALANGAFEALKGGPLDSFLYDDIKALDLSSETKVLEALGLSADVTDLGKTLESTLESYPLEDISISQLRSNVVWERLGPTENRRVHATTIFADLSGFTKFVETHMQDYESLKEAVQILHVARREFNRVATGLYGFQRVAYQGDRLQAFRRDDLIPASDAVEACIAIRASLQEVIHEKLEASKQLGISTGADSGEVVLSRVGKRGTRENACLGQSARKAAQIEELLDPQVVGITSGVRDSLDQATRSLFDYTPEFQSYSNDSASVGDFQNTLSTVAKTEKVEKNASRAVSTSDQADENKVPSRFEVDHRQMPPWPIMSRGYVNISAIASTRGFRPFPIRSDGESIPIYNSIRFEAKTDISWPYKVYWQVVNTGYDAEHANNLRGEFNYGTFEKGRSVRTERTLYKGMHWIECFIIKDGNCVARSGEFVVYIT